MPDSIHNDRQEFDATPEIVDQPVWESAPSELRTREKAATRELDTIAALSVRVG